MTTEELLRPRYKVIADYPGNYRKVGDIFSAVGDSYSIKYWCAEKDKYPHLFQRLEWWMERKGEETPEFIKSNNTIYRVDKWSKSYENIHWLGCYVNGNKKYIASEDLQPATEADYNTYLQTTNS